MNRKVEPVLWQGKWALEPESCEWGQTWRPLCPWLVSRTRRKWWFSRWRTRPEGWMFWPPDLQSGVRARAILIWTNCASSVPLHHLLVPLYSFSSGQDHQWGGDRSSAPPLNRSNGLFLLAEVKVLMMVNLKLHSLVLFPLEPRPVHYLKCFSIKNKSTHN